MICRSGLGLEFWLLGFLGLEAFGVGSCGFCGRFWGILRGRGFWEGFCWEVEVVEVWLGGLLLGFGGGRGEGRDFELRERVREDILGGV